MKQKPHRPVNLLDLGTYKKDVEERFETLLSGPQCHLEKIISEGHQEALYSLGKGDSLLIPSRCRHRVLSTAADQPTLWLALHLDAEGVISP